MIARAHRNLISPEQLANLINAYYLSGGRAGNKDQRLGQWFYNNHDTTGEAFPELFYANDRDAATLIWTTYAK